jgi:hypothetical protein
MKSQWKSQWNSRQACFFLIGTTAGTLLCALGGYFFWNKWHLHRLNDLRYRIAAIVQTGPEKEALKTDCLAELLDLSSDCPTPIDAVNVRMAEQKLLDCPLISHASVKKILPSTLYIDYAVRKPVAWLGDCRNVGLDEKGYIFPLFPFYSPKNLPEIYLGLSPLDMQGFWRICPDNRFFSLALNVLRLFDEVSWREGMRIKRIDVSNAFASSAGRREIIVLTEDELIVRENDREIVLVFPRILRLGSRNYAQQIDNFFELRRTILNDYRRQIQPSLYTRSPALFMPRIVDLRLTQYAFVQGEQ